MLNMCKKSLLDPTLNIVLGLVLGIHTTKTYKGQGVDREGSKEVHKDDK